jgi:hypothetical protein
MKNQQCPFLALKVTSSFDARYKRVDSVSLVNNMPALAAIGNL